MHIAWHVCSSSSSSSPYGQPWICNLWSSSHKGVWRQHQVPCCFGEGKEPFGPRQLDSTTQYKSHATKEWIQSMLCKWILLYNIVSFMLQLGCHIPWSNNISISQYSNIKGSRLLAKTLQAWHKYMKPVWRSTEFHSQATADWLSLRNLTSCDYLSLCSRCCRCCCWLVQNRQIPRQRNPLGCRDVEGLQGLVPHQCTRVFSNTSLDGDGIQAKMYHIIIKQEWSLRLRWIVRCRKSTEETNLKMAFTK